MTKSHRFAFFQTAMQSSDILVDTDDVMTQIDRLDPATLEEIDEILFEERMLGRRAELMADVTVGSIH